MELSEDQVIEESAKHFDHCNRKILVPYEYERTCISCGFN